MKIADRCVACGSALPESRPGIMAPFVDRRMFGRAIGMGGGALPSFCRALRCRDCGLIFSDYRPDADEMGLLYTGYRDAAYNRERTQFEPGYAAIAGHPGEDPREVAARHAAVLSFLKEAQLTASPRLTVLDYGGGDGRFIPEGIGTTGRRMLFEPWRPPVLAPGVVPVARAADARPCDLVLCQHVLEHVASPAAVLADIRSACDPETRLYVEVPLELVAVRGDGTARSVHRDCPPESDEAVIFHEHIQYWRTRSLVAALVCAGFAVESVRETRGIDIGWTRLDIIQTLCRPAWFPRLATEDA